MLNFIAATLAKGSFVYISWYGFSTIFWILLQ